MTFYSVRNIEMGPGENIVYRTNQSQPLNMFAASRLYAKSPRHGILRRRYKFPTVNDMTATQAWTGLGKSADGMVIVGKADTSAPKMVDTDREPVSVFSKVGDISEAERRVALATNSAGVVAAPAAVYGAYKLAREGLGGAPRNSARTLLKRLPTEGRSGKVKAVGNKAIAALDKPASRKLKALAIGLGATQVGLQVANASGDAIAARAMAGAKKEKS